MRTMPEVAHFLVVLALGRRLATQRIRVLMFFPGMRQKQRRGVITAKMIFLKAQHPAEAQKKNDHVAAKIHTRVPKLAEY